MEKIRQVKIEKENQQNNNLINRIKLSLFAPFVNKEKFIWLFIIIFPLVFILYYKNIYQIPFHTLMYMFLIGYAHHYITGNKPRYNLLYGVGFMVALLLWIFLLCILFFVSVRILGLGAFVGTIKYNPLLFYPFVFVIFVISCFITPILLVLYSKNFKFTDMFNLKIVFAFIVKNFVQLIQNCVISVLLFGFGLSLTYIVPNIWIFNILLEAYYAYWIYFNMHINSMVMKDYNKSL